MMNFEKRSYILTGISPILGSQPADPEIRTNFIASKAPAGTDIDAENEMLPTEDLGGLTVFLRSAEDGGIAILDYVVIGFLKEAVGALAAQNSIAMAGSKVGKYVFCEPRTIHLMRDDEHVAEPDGMCERSLRAQTMQGPRNALAASEQVDDPWRIEITLSLIPNSGTKKSQPITWNVIEDALDYGRFKGLGQWRNGGYGRFTWERKPEE